MRKGFPTMLAALALGLSSAAGAVPAQPAVDTAAVQRASAPVEEGSELRGTTGWILAAIGIALLIWGGTELLGDDDEAFPTSP